MTRHGNVEVTHDGPVVQALLDRPGRRNCVDFGIIEGLEHAVDVATAREATLLLVRGAGGNFCAGADLDLVRGLVEHREALASYVGRLGQVLNAIESGPFSSLAVVEGYAVAGGCELLLACDVVFASTDARIADRHLEHALLPGAGGSVRLVRALPRGRARWLLQSGEMLSGQQAMEWGLVTLAATTEQFDAQLEKVIARLSTRDRGAMRAVREMARGAETEDFATALDREQRIFLDYITTSVAVKEQLDAFVRRS